MLPKELVPWHLSKTISISRFPERPISSINKLSYAAPNEYCGGPTYGRTEL